MKPELFKQFGVAFPSYFVLLLTGFVFAGIARSGDHASRRASIPT